MQVSLVKTQCGQDYLSSQPQAWHSRWVSVDRDAWSVLQAANSFFDPPADGLRDVIVRLQVQTIDGSSTTETNLSDFELKFGGSSVILYEPFDQTCGVIPDELDAKQFLEGISGASFAFRSLFWKQTTSSFTTLASPST